MGDIVSFPQDIEGLVIESNFGVAIFAGQRRGESQAKKHWVVIRVAAGAFPVLEEQLCDASCCNLCLSGAAVPDTLILITQSAEGQNNGNRNRYHNLRERETATDFQSFDCAPPTTTFEGRQNRFSIFYFQFN